MGGADGNIKQIMKTKIHKVDDNDLKTTDIQTKTTKDNDNHSGRLVEYSSDSNSDSENGNDQEGAIESPQPAPSTPASPSPSPTQRRRNQQGEAVLNTFGSRGILYLLGESLRREQSIRESAMQRILRDAGVFRVRDTIIMKWAPIRYVKIFNINLSKASQRVGTYMATNIKTWAQAKQAYDYETNGLAIFATGAGLINADDPYEMGRLRHELEQCLPPLEWTDQLREFTTAPTPPPAIPIPFPQGLFSPLTSPHSPPQEHLRFPGTRNFGEDGWGQVTGVEGRRMMRAGRRGV